MSTAVFYSLFTVCQYLTLYRLLVLCHCVHCCLLQSVHCLSVPNTVPSVGSVSLCPQLFSTVCPLSVSTSHCTVCWFCVSMSTAVFNILCTVITSNCAVCWFCVSMSTAVFYILPTVCQYLTPIC